MALVPINPTQLTPPRVDLIDPRSGAISREWYRFFLSLLTATQTNQEEVELAPDATSLIASYDAMLATLAQATETQPEGASKATMSRSFSHSFRRWRLAHHRATVSCRQVKVAPAKLATPTGSF
jgi:hypothetical protein